MDNKFPDTPPADDKFPDIPPPEIVYEGFFGGGQIDEERGVTLESLRAKKKRFISMFLFLSCGVPAGILAFASIIASILRMIH